MLDRVSILGCGWLGLPLAKHLSEKGFKVKGSTTRKEKLDEIEAHGAKSYLIDVKTLESANSDFFESDVLIITIPPGQNRQDEYQLALEKVQSHVNGNLLFISSTSVYPNLNRVVTEEDASTDAKTRKGISLLEIEKVFNSPKNTIIRFAGLIGPNRHPGKWFAGKEELKGGNSQVNMIHLEDCLGIIETILKKKLWGEVFNACSPEHPLKRDYYPLLSNDLGLEPPTFAHDDQSDWKIVSSEKLTDKSGYQFIRSITNI